MEGRLILLFDVPRRATSLSLAQRESTVNDGREYTDAHTLTHADKHANADSRERKGTRGVRGCLLLFSLERTLLLLRLPVLALCVWIGCDAPVDLSQQISRECVSV